MKCLILALLVLLACTAIGAMAPNDPVFPDVHALYSTPLNAQTLKTSEADGIVTEEVMFHVEMDGEKRVDTFAYFVYPKGALGLPAVIWNQSGLAPADTAMAMYGVRRGYAMLCFDYPNLGGEYRSTVKYMINSNLVLTDDVQQAPIAHGAIAALKAVTFLQSRPEVDKERIGMAGNSWGGFFATLMAGLDPRLKACASSFGAGSLQLGCAWYQGAQRDPVLAQRWATTLDPAWRLAYARVPMLWVSSTNDHFYWMPSLMKSYALAAGPKHLAITPNWDHAAVASVAQQFAWLDVYLQGKPAFPTVTPVKLSRLGKRLLATWTFDGPPARKVTSADLMLSYGEPGNWRCRYWRVLPATIQGNRCTVELPESPVPYTIGGSITDADHFRHTTPLVAVDLKAYGKLQQRASLPIDGCADWGNFEEEQVRGFFRPHGYLPLLRYSPDAREGKQAALLPAGTTAFPRPYFIAGLPHRLTCYLKADTPVDVVLRLTGQFDHIKRSEERTARIGTEWTPVRIDYRTLPAMWTDLQLAVTVPTGASVLLDAISFRPI